MGQLGFPELILIFVVALLVFGPKKLPELGQSLGKGLREFKRATNDLKATWEDQVRDAERELSDTKKDLKNLGRDINRDINSQDIGKDVGKDVGPSPATPKDNDSAQPPRSNIQPPPSDTAASSGTEPGSGSEEPSEKPS